MNAYRTVASKLSRLAGFLEENKIMMGFAEEVRSLYQSRALAKISDTADDLVLVKTCTVMQIGDMLYRATNEEDVSARPQFDPIATSTKLRNLAAFFSTIAEEADTNKKRNRGAMRVYDPVADHKLVNDWRNSNPPVTRTEFERAKKLSAGDIQRAIDRLRKQ